MTMLLGADPELVFIAPEMKYPVLVTDFYPRNTADELGADGHPYIAELRPQPKKTPDELVREIREIFKRHKDRISIPGIGADEISWQAGSFVADKSIGGHIHFGGTGIIHPSNELVDILDGVLGQITLMMEDEEGAKRRRAGDYGFLSDIRTKPYGFEYRTPASWIVSPSIAAGVLALAKAVVLEEVEKGKFSISNLSGATLEAATIRNNDERRKFRNVDKNHFKEKLDILWDRVIRNYHYWFTEEGKPYWKNISLLRHIIKKYPDWHNDRDILERWRIRDFTPKAYRRPPCVDPIVRPEEIRRNAFAGDIAGRMFNENAVL
jgi:hypothetical protein